MITRGAAVGLCHDRVLPLELEDEGRRVAVQENPANGVDPSLDVSDPNIDHSGRIALLAHKRWRPGKLLKIRFLDGSSTMQAKVVQHANEWTQHANIQFEFGDSKHAEIRISFQADSGSWSALGTDALVTSYFPLTQPTMNFGWLRDDTNDEEVSRVVLHELGHALGAIHEHQNPQGGIVWDEEAVYKYFSGPPNYWTREQIRYNILDRYSQDQLLGTAFDPESIMLYAFPAFLTRNGVETRSNTRLSRQDIDFIKVAYPRDLGEIARIPRHEAGCVPDISGGRPTETRPHEERPDRERGTARGAGPTFRALLIGIDFYFPNRLPNGGTYLSLKGCVSDVDRVEEMLRARIEGEHDIKKLVARDTGAGQPEGPSSKWPTYANMKAAFEDLLARTQPGDQVYIHYSGHGGRVPTEHPDLKPGGYDETLVPTDIGESSTRNVRDFDIAYYLDALKTKRQAIVTIVLDSCHSGGATRGEVRPRCATGALPGFDPTLDTTKRSTGGVAPDDELRAAWNRLAATGTTPRAAIATTWLPDSNDYVLLAACSDHELAQEVSIEGAPPGGAMTTAFLDALTRLGTDQTWKTVHERILAWVRSRFPSQTPQILGKGSRQVFGVTLRPVAYTVTVMDINVPERKVLLRAGTTTGIPKGARFGLYRAGTTDFTQPDKHVGAATVDEVMATTSWAKLDEGTSIDAVELGAPACLEDVVTLQRVVHLFRRDDLPPGIDQDRALAAIAAAIPTRGRGFLKVHAEGTPYYQVAVNKDGRYEIWDSSGKPISNAAPVAIEGQGAAEHVVDQLLHLFRCQTVLDVDDMYTGLKNAIQVELRTPPPEWSPGKPIHGGTVLEGSPQILRPGAHVFVRVVNNSRGRVNIVAVDIDDHWSIVAIEPPGPTAGNYTTVEPGKDIWFAFQAYLHRGSTSAEDTIKIFATVDDSDFWWLLLPPIDTPVTRSLTTRSSAAHDALFRLREALDADQNTSRAMRPVSQPGSDWTTLPVHIKTLPG